MTGKGDPPFLETIHVHKSPCSARIINLSMSLKRDSDASVVVAARKSSIAGFRRFDVFVAEQFRTHN
ncbi:hypothetical protein GC163_12475 [bacterium]|nr:hypothetical protein [bacterium]